jgi:hypothetical protein
MDLVFMLVVLIAQASFGKVCRALLSGVILGKAIGLSDLMHKQGKSK